MCKKEDLVTRKVKLKRIKPKSHVIQMVWGVQMDLQ
jgi:hypothetical protein